MNVSIRIPLKAYGCALQLRLPDVLRLVQFGVVGGQNRVIECPLKAHVCDVDCQNPFPSWLCGPARPIHHPQERWLDPCHSIHTEWWWYEGSVLQGGVRNLMGISLVNAYGLVVKDGSYLSFFYSIHGENSSDYTAACVYSKRRRWIGERFNREGAGGAKGDVLDLLIF